MLAAARLRLAGPPLGPGPSAREATLLLARTLNLEEPQLLAHLDESLSSAELERYLQLVERRLQGEPVAYLLGRREFWGRSFFVDSRVLIPRPETEHLVEEALRLELPEDVRVLDLAAGSGCLAVTLALERARWRVTATDVSPAALAVARHNARALGAASRVAFAVLDLTAGLDLAAFDLVVCNPPYVDPVDAGSLPREVVGFEPHGALFADEGGAAVYRRLLAATAVMRSGAALVLELGAGQAERVAAAAGAAGWRVLRVAPDLRGIDRVLVARRV